MAETLCRKRALKAFFVKSCQIGTPIAVPNKNIAACCPPQAPCSFSHSKSNVSILYPLLHQGTQLDQLLDFSAQANGKTLVNEVLDRIVGKQHKFYIRISEFNLTNPDSPPTTQKISGAIQKKAKKPKQD
ncbi:hypothetical protein FRX31_013200 [Thalictrum thalictroides]|uniref:Uncharacterized protein n=1 Tax=Thalictrum thalictroides TaxID=46969 RepID=A0A7J6WJU6_THATH|nr:hypothetical protein FRX31_013200 [Thalictrum thalictroides]